MAPIILLDVQMEDLQAILSQKNWNVKTVTEELGSSSDESVIRYCQETKCILVTDNGILTQRLQATNLLVVTIDATDRANMIHEKLQERVKRMESVPDNSPKNNLEYCKQHFYLL